MPFDAWRNVKFGMGKINAGQAAIAGAVYPWMSTGAPFVASPSLGGVGPGTYFGFDPAHWAIDGMDLKMRFLVTYWANAVAVGRDVAFRVVECSATGGSGSNIIDGTLAAIVESERTYTPAASGILIADDGSGEFDAPDAGLLAFGGDVIGGATAANSALAFEFALQVRNVEPA
jgi:hypothetical protein